LRVYGIPQTQLAITPVQKHPHALFVAGVIKRAQTLTVADEQKSTDRRSNSVEE